MLDLFGKIISPWRIDIRLNFYHSIDGSVTSFDIHLKPQRKKNIILAASKSRF
jgi:hypothetical protein